MEVLQNLIAASKDTGVFHDREMELNVLLNRVENCHRILVLLGPTNSGKTSLLKRLGELLSSEPVLKLAHPVFHIDLRLVNCKTAASAIKGQLQTWASWFKKAGHSLLEGGSISVDVSEFVKLLKGAANDDLVAVMKAFKSLAYNNPQVRPVFIVDAVDKLQLWEPAEVSILMDLFVVMTKQDNRATVIFSSSDDFLRAWFNLRIDQKQWKAVGVGYFSEAHAKSYFLKLVSGTVVPDADWNKIFEVCGGDPLALRNCADDAYKHGEKLDDVLEGMVDGSQDTVEAGLSGILEQDGWDGSNYAQIMRLIVQHGGRAPLSVVREEVFAGSVIVCNKQIRAMVRQNTLHVRYMARHVKYSDVTRGDNLKDVDYLMAKRVAHFVAMKRWLAEREGVEFREREFDFF